VLSPGKKDGAVCRQSASKGFAGKGGSASRRNQKPTGENPVLPLKASVPSDHSENEFSGTGKGRANKRKRSEETASAHGDRHRPKRHPSLLVKKKWQKEKKKK